MTNLQLFFAVLGTVMALNTSLAIYLKYYIDAKIDPVGKQVDLLVQYMIQHEGKIAVLEDRSKPK